MHKIYQIMPFRVLIVGLLIVCLPGPVASQENRNSVPVVTGVRIGDHATTTRFVLDLSAKIDYHIFMLADPYRVVVDLPELNWEIPVATEDVARGVIERYRFGLFQPGTSRLVLDVNAPVFVGKTFVLPPQGPFQYRLVIDLVETDRKTFQNSKGKPPAPKLASKRVAPVQSHGGKRIVVVDPGHGGVDPGTIARNGTNEKTVTLKAGLALKKKLEATGRYSVMMTRNRDFIVPLRQRVSIARASKAELFISLHADSIKNPRIRGATVYTLSENSSDLEADALARKENKSDIIAGVDLQGETPLLTEILIDLMQRETMNYSAEFAELLIPYLGREVRMRVNSHRFAGFRVLKAPDIPSVLIEMGYLSNSSDTRFLTSRSGVNKIADAVVRAVDNYFEKHDALLAEQ